MAIFRKEKGLPEPEESDGEKKGETDSFVQEQQRAELSADQGQRKAESAVATGETATGADTGAIQMSGPVEILEPENEKAAAEKGAEPGEKTERADIVYENAEFRFKAEQGKEAKQAEPEHQAEDLGKEAAEKDAGESQEALQEKEHLVGRFSNGKLD